MQSKLNLHLMSKKDAFFPNDYFILQSESATSVERSVVFTKTSVKLDSGNNVESQEEIFLIFRVCTFPASPWPAGSPPSRPPSSS